MGSTWPALENSQLGPLYEKEAEVECKERVDDGKLVGAEGLPGASNQLGSWSYRSSMSIYHFTIQSPTVSGRPAELLCHFANNVKHRNSILDGF